MVVESLIQRLLPGTESRNCQRGMMAEADRRVRPLFQNFLSGGGGGGPQI